MIATPSTHRIREKEVTYLSLICIPNYTTVVNKDYTLFIILGFDTIQPHPGYKIGNPIGYSIPYKQYSTPVALPMIVELPKPSSQHFISYTNTSIPSTNLTQ